MTTYKTMIAQTLAAVALTAALGGCVVTPLDGHGGTVVVRPSVDVHYRWDSRRHRYYYEDRGHRRYMDRGWRPGHPHGGPPRHRNRY
jgi:hypothetical protein